MDASSGFPQPWADRFGAPVPIGELCALNSIRRGLTTGLSLHHRTPGRHEREKPIPAINSSTPFTARPAGSFWRPRRTMPWSARTPCPRWPRQLSRKRRPVAGFRRAPGPHGLLDDHDSLQAGEGCQHHLPVTVVSHVHRTVPCDVYAHTVHAPTGEALGKGGCVGTQEVHGLRHGPIEAPLDTRRRALGPDEGLFGSGLRKPPGLGRVGAARGAAVHRSRAECKRHGEGRNIPPPPARGSS